MVNNNIDPIFYENLVTYTKEEFLIDSEIEFSKIKALLDKHPKELREDPIIGMDYLRMINLIRKKRLLEPTYDPNDP